MTTSTKSKPRLSPRAKRDVLIAGGVLIALVMLVIAGSLLMGYGLRLRSFVLDLPNLVQAVLNKPSVATTEPSEYRNIVFLHRSVGNNLVEQGGVRDLFTAAGYQFWDVDDNYRGLRNPADQFVGYTYSVPNGNTEPDGLLKIFSQPVYDLPINTFSSLLQHEVIAFKSCFTSNDLKSDAQVAERKAWYLKMRDTIDQHPDRLFIALTSPPRNPAETTPEEAQRAREIAVWLTSDEFLAGHPNLVVFDLFSAFAENDPSAPDYNTIRAAYRTGSDSHPNQFANESVAPQFVEFVTRAIEQFKQAQQ
jgi:hypothetical protein